MAQRLAANRSRMANRLETRWGGAPAILLRKVTLVEESADHLPVHTCTFSIPEGMQDSLGVSIEKGDVVKVAVPEYKPKSYSMSAARDGEFDITFKVYPNGRASGFLDSTPIGGQIIVFGLSKSKTRQPGRFVGFIAFGVGITEALPIAASELAKGDAAQVLLLWASRTMGDTFWLEQMAELKATYGVRFEPVEILSREQREGTLHGRITPAVLQQVFDGHWGTAPGEPNAGCRGDVRFLTVGTKEMMCIADGMLAQIGYPMPRHGLLR